MARKAANVNRGVCQLVPTFCHIHINNTIALPIKERVWEKHPDIFASHCLFGRHSLNGGSSHPVNFHSQFLRTELMETHLTLSLVGVKFLRKVICQVLWPIRVSAQLEGKVAYGPIVTCPSMKTGQGNFGSLQEESVLQPGCFNQTA